MASAPTDDEKQAFDNKVLELVKTHDLVNRFQAFCNASAPKEKKDKCPLTNQASGKLVVDSWEKDYKKYQIRNIVDASVFSKCRAGKPSMEVNAANCAKYIALTAHEVAKRKTKKDKLPYTDDEVFNMAVSLSELVKKPEIKGVKQSATGNVGGLTDASKYTGSHKERFDADGKGKGGSWPYRNC